MDKNITQEVSKQKKRKGIFISIIFVLLLLASVMIIRASFSSTIKKQDITTAVVELGTIENTISASGEILPEFEQVITSPINASIKSVAMDAGSTVKPGKSILSLDKQTSEMEFEKLKFQLEAKKNSIQKLKLELNKSFYDIQSNNNIKGLKINSLQAAVENAKRLYKAGGGTREAIEQAELDLKVALLEKKQLENEIKSKQQTMKVDIRESEIAAQIQQTDLSELKRKLQQASIIANRAGVVTWVNKNIGATVQDGEILARIADLGSYKVSGTISDSYLNELRTGLPAIIRINDSTVRGSIVNIHPTIQNGIVSFDVQLDERNSKLYRPNMKVDVFVVTNSKKNAMRVANGPAFKGGNTQDIFVVSNGKAQRRKANIGLSNFDYVEIKDHVKPGEVVITSDMSDYKNSKEITINN
ncbi:MAG TPA: HlyD family efflux transporter periplasmic adaptor subunit [Segetibacter sp.]|nr:HlyD family efflux transporter periplasmic adaptor subunit [Segetibacter sp.]